MKILWSLAAVTDREIIFDHIEADSLFAAVRIDNEIETQVDKLTAFPKIGRPGRVSETRELIIQRLPYIATYEIKGDTVRILRVLHGAQQWLDKF